MNFKRYIILAIGLLLLTLADTNAQEEYDFSQYQGKVVKSSVQLYLEEAYFHRYDSTYKAKAVGVTSNTTPEELMVSYFSVSNKQQYNKLFINEVPDVSSGALKVRSGSDTLFNYFELIHKLSYKEKGIQTAIIKYYEVENGQRTALHSVKSVEQNGQWFILNIDADDDVQFVLRLLRTDTLIALKNKGKSDDVFLENLREKTRKGLRVLSISKLSEVLKQWQKEGDLESLRRTCDI